MVVTRPSLTRRLLHQLNSDRTLLRSNLCIRMHSSTEQNVYLFQRHILRFRDEEPHIEEEQHADGAEHVHSGIKCQPRTPSKRGCRARKVFNLRIKALICQEEREDLLQNGIRDILRLRRDGDGLVAHVHAEDLTCPNPGRGAPRRLEEEGEQEHQKNGRDADWPRLLAVGAAWRFRHDGGGRDHADCHADGADEQEEAAAVAVDDPGCVEREEDSEGAVESIDELDRGVVGEDVLVDDGAVVVQRALAGELLADVQEDCEYCDGSRVSFNFATFSGLLQLTQSPPDRLILPKRRIARDVIVLLELDGTADIARLGLHAFVIVSDQLQGFDGFFDTVLLDVPARAFGAEVDQRDDDQRREKLKNQRRAPVPVAEAVAVVGAGVVDPVGEETAYGEVHLPGRVSVTMPFSMRRWRI